ncbi:MAG: hypothetical protein ACFWT0_01885 [Bifidobacterium crudilactis]|jgi:hypothetical protein
MDDESEPLVLNNIQPFNMRRYTRLFCTTDHHPVIAHTVQTNSSYSYRL